MVEEPGTERRRRRRRPGSSAPTPAAPAAAPPERAARRPQPSGETNRALRDLAGAGRSQLGVSRALRGRDVNRPTDEDLAEAEDEVVIVRRSWKP